MLNYPTDSETIKELKDLVTQDTYLLSPEIGVRYDSIHQGLNKSKRPISNTVDYHFDVATRYYDDGKYARAYALSPYTCGVAIFGEKDYDSFTIMVLGEDDGGWYISDHQRFEWIYQKSEFVMLVSEALSVFNNNYKNE